MSICWAESVWWDWISWDEHREWLPDESNGLQANLWGVEDIWADT